MVQLLKFRKVFSPRLSDLLQAQTEEAPRGFAAIKENQKIKRQKSLRWAAGRIGEESSGAGRNQYHRQ